MNPCETGNQAHNRILDTYVAPVLGIPRTSQNLQTLAIFNTFTYGGIGGTQATTSGGSPQGPLISLHEIGHSLGTLADEYPYSSRDVVRPCYTGGEPGSFHHTIHDSAAQMLAAQTKWWRWLGEESLSGGMIGLHEGGGTFPCGQRRPSEHSMMRWIGFDLDQIGLEHMVARVTGMRNSGQMNVQNTPRRHRGRGTRSLWLETGHPRFHERQRHVADRRPDRPGDRHRQQPQPRPRAAEPRAGHGRARRGARPGRARTASTGCATRRRTTAATDSGYNGPRFVQTRTWTVGDTTVTPSAPAADITAPHGEHPPGRRRRGRLRRDQPPDRPGPPGHVVDQRRRRSPNPTQQPQPRPRRAEPAGGHAHADGDGDRRRAVGHGRVEDRQGGADRAADGCPRRWPRCPAASEHPVYFNGWDMWLDPAGRPRPATRARPPSSASSA